MRCQPLRWCIIRRAHEEDAMAIRLLCWEGYDDPNVLAPFEHANGVGIHADTHICDFVATQRVLADAGTWDIVNVNSPFVRDVLAPQGRILRLDDARFNNWKDAGPMSDAWRALCQWATGPDDATI